MIFDDIAKKLSEHFHDVKIDVVEGAKNPVSGALQGDPFLVVPTEKIKEVCNLLKVMDQFAFDCLSNLTAVDRKDKFEVVYHLFSYKNKHSLTIKAYLPRDDNARIETLEDLWSAANWLEREVYDLFGIKFDGHSDLRRIMLPDDWVGHPLRKDYKEAEEYHGISTTRPPLIQ